MLTYSIKKKNLFMSAMDNLNFRRNHPAPAGRAPDRLPISDKLSKLEFESWIDHHVRSKYKVGDYVTFNYTPVNVGQCPTVLRVSYIEEIYTLARWNTFRNEAEVINTQMEYGGYQMRCPCEIRPLTKEELSHVDVLDLNKKLAAANIT